MSDNYYKFNHQKISVPVPFVIGYPSILLQCYLNKSIIILINDILLFTNITTSVSMSILDSFNDKLIEFQLLYRLRIFLSFLIIFMSISLLKTYFTQGYCEKIKEFNYYYLKHFNILDNICGNKVSSKYPDGINIIRDILKREQ